MSALKIGNVLRAGLMAWALFMDLNVRSGDNYVNIGQSLVGTSGAVALAALACLLALSWADERLPKGRIGRIPCCFAWPPCCSAGCRICRSAIQLP